MFLKNRKTSFTILGPDIGIDGDLAATADLHLEGRVDGDIKCAALVQGETSEITGMVGIAVGLLISAMVKTSEMATSLVPLILIPQILFSGLVGVPQGWSKVVGTLMPATWSFDEIKRWSWLDTLDEEGSFPDGDREAYSSSRIA